MPSFIIDFLRGNPQKPEKGWQIVSAKDKEAAWYKCRRHLIERIVGITEIKPGEYRLYCHFGDETNYAMRPNLTLVSALELARRWDGPFYILRRDGTDIRDLSDRPIWRMRPMPPGAKLVRWGAGEPSLLWQFIDVRF